uniref:DNA-directed DNA polymerase n=1 Tax=Trichogramma kaykai TaxID=54128 RepID=A0ABD2W1K0_9HYME
MNEIENIPVVAEMLFDQENDLLLSDTIDYIEQQAASSFDPTFPTTSVENERQDGSTRVVQEAQEWSIDEEENMHMLEENINSEILNVSSFDPIFPSSSENERQDGSTIVIQEAQEWSVDEEGDIHMLEENINSEIPSTSSANEIQDRNDDFNQQVSSSSVSSHDNIPLVILDSDEEESAGDIRKEIKPIHPFFGPYRRVTPQRPRIISDIMLKTAKIRPLRVADTRTSARTRPYTRRNSNPVVEPNESPDIFGNLSNLGLQMGRGRSIPQRFIIVREEGRYYRRFRLRGTQMTIRFAQPPPTVNWLVHMEDTFEELHTYLASLDYPKECWLTVSQNPDRMKIIKGWFYNSKAVGGTVVCLVLKRVGEKATASGFPSDNMTESEKDEYIRELETHEEVRLNRDEILFNAGMRYVAKLCCNCLWGKTAQKMDLPRTLTIKDVKILMELLCSNAIIVNSVLPVNEYTLYTGSMLGQLTDELAVHGAGTYITAFVSGGPKFYAFKYKKPNGEEDFVCKVKGIRLNYANSQLVNFEKYFSSRPRAARRLAQFALHRIISQCTRSRANSPPGLPGISRGSEIFAGSLFGRHLASVRISLARPQTNDTR